MRKKDKIICNVSSYNRKNQLLKTIESIYDQCDIINIFLNEYHTIPETLIDDKILITTTDNEKGDAYKFQQLSVSDGYYLTIDDDLIYPKNYVENLINQIEKYGRKSIITFHGRSFHDFPIKSYYKDNDVYIHFTDELLVDTKVQFGGTGVMGFHTDLLKIDLEYFKYPNMADVWVGKYTKENDIDIICVKKPKNYIIQQKIQETIFKTHNKNDKIQTKITNISYTKKDISIIIPTYNNVDYIDECLESISKSGVKFNYEVIVGIDGCDETLSHIKEMTYNYNVRFYYFEKNSGAYVVRNTLIDLVNSEKIIFFDSDDIMRPTMIESIIKYLNDFDYVKPKMFNFRNTNTEVLGRGKWGEGVFGIRKSVVDYLNGFEPWPCAADSEFMTRLKVNNFKGFLTKEILMNRRIHNNSLTVNSETGMGSDKRKTYSEKIKNKKDRGPLTKKVKSSCYLINNRWDFNQEINFQTDMGILPNNKLPIKNFQPKRVKKTIDYKKINKVLPKEKIQKSRKVEKQNKPKDRNILTKIRKGSIVEQNFKMANVKNKKTNLNSGIF